jgi:hypothetical protein
MDPYAQAVAVTVLLIVAGAALVHALHRPGRGVRRARRTGRPSRAPWRGWRP